MPLATRTSIRPIVVHSGRSICENLQRSRNKSYPSHVAVPYAPLVAALDALGRFQFRQDPTEPSRPLNPIPLPWQCHHRQKKTLGDSVQDKAFLRMTKPDRISALCLSARRVLTAVGMVSRGEAQQQRRNISHSGVVDLGHISVNPSVAPWLSQRQIHQGEFNSQRNEYPAVCWSLFPLWRRPPRTKTEMTSRRKP